MAEENGDFEFLPPCGNIFFYVFFTVSTKGRCDQLPVPSSGKEDH
jgi:hypothetical protein